MATINPYLNYNGNAHKRSPWGSYFGMFRDKYGIEWMVDFDPNYKGQI